MTVLQALDRCYDRLARREGGITPPGWSAEAISMVIEIDRDGTLLGCKSWLDDKGKGRPCVVPKWFGRSGTASTPFFLWDNAAYALGLRTAKDKDAKAIEKIARHHAAFRDLHLGELGDETDDGLVALRRFIESWSPAQGAPDGVREKMLAAGIAFQLRGEERFIHEQPAALAHVERLRLSGPSAATEGFCLIRGARLPLVRLHPKIKGVGGGSTSEMPLVSFEPHAFRSYGKEQGLNAPTSELAAFRYGASLNALLRANSGNRIRIAGTTAVFWADASAYDEAWAEKEKCARAAEDIFAVNMGSEIVATTDKQEEVAVRGALESVRMARAERGVSPDLLAGVPFYVLGLAPNAGRIVVRFWLSGSFERFAEALDRHTDAIKVEPEPQGWGGKPPSIARILVKTTALQEKFDNIPDGLTGDVARAILAGTPYPRTWLSAAITRLRAGDPAWRGWHAAAIKACLTRTRGELPVPVGLDEKNESQAYQLGRLFAVLEAAQRAALGQKVNATIADRYFGAASSTPARVFASLIRNGKIHAADARRRNKARWIEPRLADIIARLPGDLPKTLRLEDQGRFAIGYYHERVHKSPDRDDDDNTDQPTKTSETE